MPPVCSLSWVAMLSVCLIFSSDANARQGEQPTRPNIVVILVDDMGFSDLGCYGGEIHTPNIDRLAAGGLRFRQFYNCARCCPTRASLLSGLYAHQVGLKVNGHSLTHDGATIAEVLRASGYQTAMAGKWHLSFTETLQNGRHLQWVNHQVHPRDTFGPLGSYPVNRGFDEFYGVIWGVVNYFDPFSLVEQDKPVREVPDDYYITDAITGKSVDYIHEFGESDKPFFLYVAHCAPHWPLHAKGKDIAKYRHTYQDGWHELRRRRYERMVTLGLINANRYPRPHLHGTEPDWDQLNKDARQEAAAQMATHAAMTDCVDQGVGKIIAALEETEQFDNTILFIFADNGASPERYRNPGYDRPSHTREGEQIQYRGRFTPGPETTWGYIGPWWANAANTPFRYWKKESFEGGCHTPLIVHWPVGLKTKEGAITDQIGHVIDIMPTCLEIAGADYPERFNGHAIAALEGTSLLPILEGRQSEGHRVLFFEHVGGRAIRAGDWKLVALEGRPWELYDLSKDRTETNNLAKEHRHVAKRLEQQWNAWAERVGAAR